MPSGIKFSPDEIDSVHSTLRKLESSPVFVHADRMLRLLRHIVEEVLAERADRINQFSLGLDVFDRDEHFDPAVDSVVRVEASRLRSKLRDYYSTDGQSDKIRFELPKGTYVPEIHIGTDRDDTYASSSAAAEVDSRLFPQFNAKTSNS